ncbi:S4 domain-containing protein [uncultured Microbulbifer sp.]|uniref:RNA-binding S4 domain-containing protein n=1 Tax=uncultured Microbulbifer sp. TaxID=348147 RepID=UPI00262FD7CD|nr:S4 domain-containing protein [uncultured Microbulbifer sp.]
MEKIRIDKWLWAARFFKTRSLAKQAIEGGKIHVGGQRVKASKEITVGASLSIRQGWDLVEIAVIALSDRRRDAEFARTLYREAEHSAARRERERAERQVANAGIQRQRPNKKQRRQIHRFLREQD